VTVVNIVFPGSPAHPLIPPGFGYLVPRPEADYTSDAPAILGTVFDSSTLPTQDRHVDDEPTTLKVTVMMGGPYPPTSDQDLISHIVEYLARQLSPSGQRLPEPLLYRIHRHKNCIPTYTVGHVERMAELREALAQSPWSGKLEVIGSGVGGISVNDCVSAARNLGKGWSSI